MLKDGAVQWLDYSSSPIIGLAITPTLTCASCEDGTLIIYSNNGVKLLAPIRLDSPASFTHAAKDFVMIITCKGTMSAWSVPRSQSTPSEVHLTNPTGISRRKRRCFLKLTFNPSSHHRQKRQIPTTQRHLSDKRSYDPTGLRGFNYLQVLATPTMPTSKRGKNCAIRGLPRAAQYGLARVEDPARLS